MTADAATEIQQLQALREQHKSKLSGKVQYPPLSVFGHADPVGPAVDPDGYNKALSGRRATAVYALLIVNSNPDAAVNLWRKISATEHWGTKQRKAMQANVPAGTSDGDLFKVYMQKLCPADFKLTPQDFLAQGADSKGKGDYQGCSSFNPLLIFSQQEETQYEQAEQNTDQAGIEARNAANAENRRVMVLLFRPGSQVVPAKWPCPSATDAKAGCIKRFWSDSERRRHSRLPDTDRKFDNTHDTFACRFYQRLLDKSPCEKIVPLVILRIRLIQERQLNHQDQPFDGVSYRLEVADTKHEGVVGKDGMLEHLIPVDATSGKLTLLQKPDQGDPVVFWTLNLDITDSLEDSTQFPGAQARLNNLGMFAGEQITGQEDDQTDRALQRFQTLYQVKDQQVGNVETSGDLTAPTSDKLKEIYGG